MTPEQPRARHHAPTACTALAAAFAAATLAACSGAAEAPPMGGYAEAELVYVAPPAAGVLQSVAVRRGDAVSKGQLLFTLDADAEALVRDGAAARRDQAEAQAADLRKGRRPEELRTLEQQLAQARATAAASDAALKRQRDLVAQGFVSALQLDSLRAASERDAAGVQATLAQLALAREAARSDQIAAAAAAARGSNADLQLARWREGQRERVAPADAVVFDVIHRNGEWVGAGAPVVALLPPGAVKLIFFVPEPALPQAAIGTEVQLSCDGCPAGLTARIRWVSPQAEFTPPVIYGASSRAKLVYRVEATPAAGTALKPGQPVDVRWARAAP